MSEEPTYHYVKGQGWVPARCETRSINIHKWRVTVFNEPPQVGDYFARSHGRNLDSIIESIKRESWIFENVAVNLMRFGETIVDGAPFLRIEVDKI